MKLSLTFDGNGKASVNILAETDAEKSILAWVAEGYERWRVAIVNSYRIAGVEKVQLVEVAGENHSTPDPT